MVWFGKRGIAKSAENKSDWTKLKAKYGSGGKQYAGSPAKSLAVQSGDTGKQLIFSPGKILKMPQNFSSGMDEK